MRGLPAVPSFPLETFRGAGGIDDACVSYAATARPKVSGASSSRVQGRNKTGAAAAAKPFAAALNLFGRYGTSSSAGAYRLGVRGNL